MPPMRSFRTILALGLLTLALLVSLPGTGQGDQVQMN
jgi:hypothetical protein